jgi:hypothetical protein
MTDPTFTPTEDQIAAVLKKTGSDPRDLAIAYLRATKRARDSESAFKIMDGLAGASMGLATGDMGEVKRNLQKAVQEGRTHKQASEAKP